MLKHWIRPLIRPLPQWSPVALASPQCAVSACMRWEGGEADVTTDHTVASLKPLVIASSLDAGQEAIIDYRDRHTGELIGSLRLGRMVSLAIDRTPITLYHVTAGIHHCLRWPHRDWNRWLQNRAMLRQPSSQHALMTPTAVQQLMVAYLCPRPVVLVSVSTPEHRNMFPMDLIGPLAHGGLYSLALRNTNVSADIIRRTGHVALSCIPATMKPAAYKLSEHHRLPLIDWEDLPFPVRPSQERGIPIVAEALCAQELTILHSQDIGSHIFFIGRMASDERLAEGCQLHHTPGFYQAYRRQRRMAFAEA